jgi:hypothetical protein
MLQSNHDFIIQQKKSQEAEMSTPAKRIAVLVGETQGERTAKERLTAEKEFNQNFSYFQNYFDSDEAELYKSGQSTGHSV